jgi:glycine oxidase
VKVVVIGAGIAGLSIGWRLCQRGAEVVVLDRAQPGRGATWAAAGMIAATAETADAQTPEAAFAYRARALWPDFAREIEEASGVPIGYSQSGSLMVAADAQDAAHQTERARTDPDLAVMSGAEACAMEPMLAPAAPGALWAAKEAQVDNRALGDALAKAYRRVGGMLRVNEAVVRMEIAGDRAIAALTQFARHEADAFVLAAGAWSGTIAGLPPEMLPPVKPMKGEMLALVPPAGVAIPGHVVWSNEVYLVPRGRRLLIGATLEDAGFDTSLTDAAQDWLSTRAVRAMPSLKDWRIDEHWAGLRPGSPDGLPMLGRSAVDGLYVATGQHRNGILFAPAIAEILPRFVLERAPEPPEFSPRRFSHGVLAPGAGVG